jgi:hypothetical protein
MTGINARFITSLNDCLLIFVKREPSVAGEKQERKRVCVEFPPSAGARDYSWANANRFICQSDEKLVAQVLKIQNKAAPFSGWFIDPSGHCRRVTN